MAIAKILGEELRDEILFPDDFPLRNSAEFGQYYTQALARRLKKKKPKYRYIQLRGTPEIEDLPFYQDILVGEDQDREQVVVERILEIFQYDREVVAAVIESIGFEDLPHFVRRPNFGTVLSAFLENCNLLDEVLQEVSAEKGDGSYIVTIDEIIGLDPREGMNLLILKLDAAYRKKMGILSSPISDEVKLIEVNATEVSDYSLGREETLEAERRELDQQVQKIIEEETDV